MTQPPLGAALYGEAHALLKQADRIRGRVTAAASLTVGTLADAGAERPRRGVAPGRPEPAGPQLRPGGLGRLPGLTGAQEPECSAMYWAYQTGHSSSYFPVFFSCSPCAAAASRSARSSSCAEP